MVICAFLQEGCSPLMTACTKGSLDVVNVLLEADCAVNCTDKVVFLIPYLKYVKCFLSFCELDLVFIYLKFYDWLPRKISYRI